MEFSSMGMRFGLELDGMGEGQKVTTTSFLDIWGPSLRRPGQEGRQKRCPFMVMMGV